MGRSPLQSLLLWLQFLDLATKRKTESAVMGRSVAERTTSFPILFLGVNATPKAPAVWCSWSHAWSFEMGLVGRAWTCLPWTFVFRISVLAQPLTPLYYPRVRQALAALFLSRCDRHRP